MEFGLGSFAYFGQPDVFNLWAYRFGNFGNGSGYNQVVADNTAAIINNSPFVWTICSQATLCIDFASGYSGDLPDTLKNQDVIMEGPTPV